MQEKRQSYLDNLYNLYLDIEKKFLKKDLKEVDRAETLVRYTRNQFISEFKHMMENDEAKTLKFQMLGVSGFSRKSSQRLSNEWKWVQKGILTKILHE